MSDYKTPYSEASLQYTNEIVPKSLVDQNRYNRSKKREEEFDESWKAHPVNINEICERFAPGATAHKVGYYSGVKYIFEGSEYRVITDMASGYLRIQNIQSNKYVKLDGTPGNLDETHFKILKKEEM